ncbi:unnamed protein product [Diabrotica balteata]|uniref:Uncharacterized protein n=1 Tax=Diabrotica balteata TaxID=107213 RepID=A0A9N9SQI7_DIABA|nr:unnamed protein product [Diabrotica balteata]
MLATTTIFFIVFVDFLIRVMAANLENSNKSVVRVPDVGRQEYFIPKKRYKPALIDPMTYSILADHVLHLMPHQRTVLLIMNIYQMKTINPAHPSNDPDAPSDVIIVAIRFIMEDLFQPIGGLLVYSEEDQSQTIADCIKAYIRDLWRLGVYVIGSISPPFPLFKEVFQRFHPEKNFDEVPGPILYSVLPFKNIVHIYDVQYLVLKLQLLLRQGDIRFETMFGRQREYLVKWSDLFFVINAHPQFKVLATFFANNLEVPKRVHVFNDDIYKMYVHLENNGFLSGYSAGARVFIHTVSALMQYFDYDYVHVRKTVYNWDDLMYTLSKMKFQRIDVPYMQNPSILKTKKRKKKKSRRADKSKLEDNRTKVMDSKNKQTISEALSSTKDSVVNEKQSVKKSLKGNKKAKAISKMNLKSKELRNEQLYNVKDNVGNSENIITAVIEKTNKIAQLNLHVKDGRIENVPTSNNNSVNSEDNFVSSLVSEIFLTITEGQMKILPTNAKINLDAQEQTMNGTFKKPSESPKISPEFPDKKTETQIEKQSKSLKISKGISKQNKEGELETKAGRSESSAEIPEAVMEEQLEKRQKITNISSGLLQQTTEKHLEKQSKLAKTSPGHQEKSTEGQLGKRTKSQEQLENRQKLPKISSGLPQQTAEKQLEKQPKIAKPYPRHQEKITEGQLEKRIKSPKIDPEVPEQQSKGKLDKEPEFLKPPPGFTAKRKEQQLEKQLKNPKTSIEYNGEGQLEKLSDVSKQPSRFTNRIEGQLEKRPKGPRTPPGSPPPSPDSGDRGGYIERTRELVLQHIPVSRKRATPVSPTSDSLPSTSAQVQTSGLKKSAKKLDTVAIQETKNTCEVSDLKNTISIKQITEKLRMNQVSIREELGKPEQEISITSTTTGATYKTFVQNDGPIPDNGFEKNVVTSELICSMRGIMVLTESAKSRKLQSMRSDAIIVEPIDLFMAKIQSQFNGIKNVYYYGTSYRLLEPDTSFSCLENDSGLYLIKRG